MKVKRIETPTSTLDRAEIANYLATISDVVFGKTIKDSERLLKRLLKEAYGSTPSRVLEFLPCTISEDTSRHLNMEDSRQFFGFFDNDRNYYTNAREILNWGSLSFDDILKYVNFDKYTVVKCKAPYFIYGQLSTHNQITSLCHSNRYSASGLGYWCPVSNYDSDDWTNVVVNSSPIELTRYMQYTLHQHRREVYARGVDMLEYRDFCLGGYTNNINAWDWFINQRSDKHTQKETREFVKEIKHCVYCPDKPDNSHDMHLYI